MKRCTSGEGSGARRAHVSTPMSANSPRISRATSSFMPRLPPEFLIMRHRPEPWRPADSILTVKMMALTLGTNLDREIDRLSYAAQGLICSSATTRVNRSAGAK